MPTFRQQIKLDESITKNTKYCDFCGHSIVFNKTAKTDKILCTHCGHYLFRDEKAKKEYNKQIFMNTLKRHLI